MIKSKKVTLNSYFFIFFVKNFNIYNLHLKVPTYHSKPHCFGKMQDKFCEKITKLCHYYMRASQNKNNLPVVNYSLNHNIMRGFIPLDLLKNMTMVPGSRFSNGVPMTRVEISSNYIDSYSDGNLLFDIKNDPKQLNNIKDGKIKKIVIKKIIKKLKSVDTPIEVYQRLGLEI